jgi:hypothetical protein
MDYRVAWISAKRSRSFHLPHPRVRSRRNAGLAAVPGRVRLSSDVERIDVGADQIEIHTRPSRLGALLDGASTLSPSATDDETHILSVPVRLRCSGREIRMLIDSTDPSVVTKPDARLVKLLIRAHRFHVTLIGSPACPSRHWPSRKL